MSQTEDQDEIFDFADECRSGERGLSAEFADALEIVCSSGTQVDVTDESNEDVIMSMSASQRTDIAPEEEKKKLEDNTDWRLKFEKEQSLRKQAKRNVEEARSCTRKLRVRLREERAKNAEMQNDIRLVREIFLKYMGT